MTAARPSRTAVRLAAAEAAAAELVADLHADVDQELATLTELAWLTHDLVDTRQRGTLPFLTAETRARLDTQLVDERRERRGQPGRDLGLRFLNRDTATSGTGAIAAPVTVTATSWEGEAWATLAHSVARTEVFLTRLTGLADHTRGWCDLPRRVWTTTTVTGDQAPTVVELVVRLRDLAAEPIGPARLRELHRDVRHLVTLAETVVDGADRMHVGSCPHCGRDTLVAYFRDGTNAAGDARGGFIRCDKDPTTGKHEKCVCPDAWCECKKRPWTHRHTWWRSTRQAPNPVTAKDWHDLAGRVQLYRRAKPTTDPTTDPSTDTSTDTSTEEPTP